MVCKEKAVRLPETTMTLDNTDVSRNLDELELSALFPQYRLKPGLEMRIPDIDENLISCYLDRMRTLSILIQFLKTINKRYILGSRELFSFITTVRVARFSK